MRLEQWLYAVPLRLRSLFRRQRVEQDLDEELQDHLERKIADYIAQGLSPLTERLCCGRLGRAVATAGSFESCHVRALPIQAG